MTKYLFDPAASIMKQMRFMCLPEHLPVHEAIVYRFFDAGNNALYIGVTVSPRGRWQAHKNGAPWWSQVRAVSVEHYPHERAALDAEVVAIKAEAPPYNRRSAPTQLVRDSCAAHESRARYSDVVLPRVGGGVGVGDGFGAIHASRLTSANPAPVDNGTAAATSGRHAWMAASRQIGGRS